MPSTSCTGTMPKMLPFSNIRFTSFDVALTYTGSGNSRGLWSFTCYHSDTKIAVLDEQNRPLLVSETQSGPSHPPLRWAASTRAFP